MGAREEKRCFKSNKGNLETRGIKIGGERGNKRGDDRGKKEEVGEKEQKMKTERETEGERMLCEYEALNIWHDPQKVHSAFRICILKCLHLSVCERRVSAVVAMVCGCVCGGGAVC